MNKIKIVTMVLALMTTSAFADFTVKDLFVSGGTNKPVKTDNNKPHDCQ